MAVPRARVAVDVGGTFVDVLSHDPETGEIAVEKQPATPDRPAEAVLAGLQRLAHPIDAIDRLFHGSTVVLNAILQQRGAKVGLITTRGFRDVLELGRGARPHIYDWLSTPPDPLVPRHLRREVRERTAADGSEVAPLDVDELDREVERLVELGVEAIAICFLHSYADPKHEALAAQRIREGHRGLWVTMSSDVATEWREFERTSTAVLNAFVQPAFARYLEDLGDGLREAGYPRTIAVMQSGGGVMDAARAAALPVRTLMSGPAGGAIGGRELAAELGLGNVICADVGGTSFDVTVIEGGEILERAEVDLGGRPVLAPFIDIVSVGAGGGSIAWIDGAGSLRVGPQSAGARPGPACFGFGGAEPTVTDCELLLGRLDPESFLGSRMRLDVGAARAALLEKIAVPLGMKIEVAAAGVLTIARTSMSAAIHAMTVERGVDPRELTLLAFGGAGGLFAAATADELEIPRVIVPRAPANFSAWGILASDYREDASLTRVRPLHADAVEGLRGDLDALGRQVLRDLGAYGFDETCIRVDDRLDMRFDGQEHTIAVPVDPSWTDDDAFLDGSRERFASLHRRLYGHGDAAHPIEVVTARSSGIAPVERPRWPEWTVSLPGDPKGRRRAHLGTNGRTDTPVFDRDRLALDQRVEGPAIVEEWTTTILVPPGWGATVDRIGNLVMEPG